MDILEYIGNKNGLNRDRIREFEALLNTDYMKSNSHKIEVPPAIANYYIGDFYGLLRQYFLLDPHVWYFILRMNNLHNPIDYNGKREIIIPDEAALDTIISLLRDKEKR